MAARSHGKDWQLDNGEDRHAENPRSFFIPSRAERESLLPGSPVKLMFELLDRGREQPSAERMWVEVTAVENGRYLGELRNHPSAIQGLAAGDLIRFGPEHVIALENPEWAPYEDKVAFVNRRLIEDADQKPGFVVHDPHDEELPPRSDGTRASGWQLLLGDESEEELSDGNNITAPNLAWLMERYPAFGDLVFSGARQGEWALNQSTGRYDPADAQE